MSIVLPENYPDTIMATRLRTEMKGTLFDATVNVKSVADLMDERTLYDKLQNRFGNFGDHYLFVHFFFMMPKQLNLPLTLSEDIILRGLGKRALCAGISYLINSMNINPDNTLIMLDAYGGKFRNHEDEIALNNKYKNLGQQDLLNELRKILPEYYEEFMTFPPNIMKNLIIGTILNDRLIEYYKNTYGFEVMERSPNEALSVMATTARKCLNKCEEPKLGTQHQYDTILPIIQSMDIIGFYINNILNSKNSLITVYDKLGNIHTSIVYYDALNGRIYPAR